MKMVLNSKLKQWLEINFQERVKFDEPMANHTSLRVGGPADAFVITENKKELAELIHWAGQNSLNWFVIGGGTNLLVSDSGIRGIAIVLTKELEEVTEKSENGKIYLLKAAAGLKMQSLCRLAIKKGAKGILPIMDEAEKAFEEVKNLNGAVDAVEGYFQENNNDDST